MSVLFSTAGKPTAPIASSEKDTTAYFHADLSPEGWLSFFYVTAWEQVFHGALTTPEPVVCMSDQPPSVQHYCKRWQELRSSCPVTADSGVPQGVMLLQERVLKLACELFDETHETLLLHSTTKAERALSCETLRRALQDDSNAIITLFRLHCVKLLIGPSNPLNSLMDFGNVVRGFLQRMLLGFDAGSSSKVSAHAITSNPEEEQLHVATALYEFLCLVHGMSDVSSFVAPPPTLSLDDSETTRWTRVAEQIVDAAPGQRAAQSSRESTMRTPLLALQGDGDRTHVVRQLSVGLSLQYALARVYTVLLLPQWGSTRQLCASKLSGVISTLSCAFPFTQGCGLAPLSLPCVQVLSNPFTAPFFRPLESGSRQAVSLGVTHEVMECVRVSPMIAMPTSESASEASPPHPQVQVRTANGQPVPADGSTHPVHCLIKAEQRRQAIVAAIRALRGSVDFPQVSWIAPSHAALLLCAIVDCIAAAAAAGVAVADQALQSAAEESSDPTQCPFQRFVDAVVESSTQASAGTTGVAPLLFCTPTWSIAYTAATHHFQAAAAPPPPQTDSTSEPGKTGATRTAPAQIMKASSRSAPAMSTSNAHLSGSGTKVSLTTLIPQSVATAIVDSVHELLFSLVSVPAPQDFHHHETSNTGDFFSALLLTLQTHTRRRLDLLKVSVSRVFTTPASDWLPLLRSNSADPNSNKDLDPATQSLALLLCSAEATARCDPPGIRTAEQSDAFLLELFPTLLQQMGYEWPWSELLRQLKQLTRQRQNDFLNNADAIKSDQRHLSSPTTQTLYHLLADALSQQRPTDSSGHVDAAALLRLAALQIESSLPSVEHTVWSQGHLRFFDRDGAASPSGGAENESSLLARLFADVLMHRIYWARLEQILPISFNAPVVEVLSPLFNPARTLSSSPASSRSSPTVFLMPTYYAPGGNAVVDFLLAAPYVFAVAGATRNTAASIARGGTSMRTDHTEWMGESRSLIEEVERRLYTATNACELVLKVKTSRSLSPLEKVKLTARYTAETLIAALICVAFAEDQKQASFSKNGGGGGGASSHRGQFNWLNSSAARSKLQRLLRCFAPILERLQMEIDFGVSFGDRRQTDTELQGGEEEPDAEEDSDSDEALDSAEPIITLASITCCKGLDSPFLVCSAPASTRQGQGRLRFDLTPVADDLCNRCGYSFYPLEWAADVASVSQGSFLSGSAGSYSGNAWGMGSQMNAVRMPYSPFAAVAHQLRLHWGEETQYAMNQAQQNLGSAPQLTRSLADTLFTYRFLEALLGCMFDTREPGAISYARGSGDSSTLAGKPAAQADSRGAGASKRARGVMTLWGSTQAKRPPPPSNGTSQLKDLPSQPASVVEQADVDPSVFFPTHTVVKATDVLAATYQCMLPQQPSDATDDSDDGIAVTEKHATAETAQMQLHMKRISAVCQSRAQSWRWNKAKVQQQATEAVTILLGEVDTLRNSSSATKEPLSHEILSALQESRAGERIGSYFNVAAVSGTDASGALLAAAVAVAATIAPEHVSAEVLGNAARTVARYVGVNAIAERSAYSVDAEPYARRIISKWSLRVSENNARKKSLLKALRECNSSDSVQLASSLEEETAAVGEVLNSLFPNPVAVNQWCESISQNQAPANQLAPTVWRAATLTTLEQLLSAIEADVNVPLSSPLSLLAYSTVGH